MVQQDGTVDLLCLALVTEPGYHGGWWKAKPGQDLCLLCVIVPNFPLSTIVSSPDINTFYLSWNIRQHRPWVFRDLSTAFWIHVAPCAEGEMRYSLCLYMSRAAGWQSTGSVWHLSNVAQHFLISQAWASHQPGPCISSLPPMILRNCERVAI